MNKQEVKYSVTSVLAVVVPVGMIMSLMFSVMSLSEPDVLPRWFTRTVAYSGVLILLISLAWDLKVAKPPSGSRFFEPATLFGIYLWLVVGIGESAWRFVPPGTRLSQFVLAGLTKVPPGFYRSLRSGSSPLSALAYYCLAWGILTGRFGRTNRAPQPKS